MDFKELLAYQKAFELAMQIFQLSKRFPAEEKYSLIDQIRRYSRSVCVNLAEAYRKRRYPNHFVSKLTTVMLKIPRQTFGLNLHLNVTTYQKMNYTS